MLQGTRTRDLEFFNDDFMKKKVATKNTDEGRILISTDKLTHVRSEVNFCTRERLVSSVHLDKWRRWSQEEGSSSWTFGLRNLSWKKILRSKTPDVQM